MLAGLLWRGRAAAVLGIRRLRRSRSSLGNSLVTLWPARFYNASFWVLKQGVYDVLKMALALELAWRAFGAFPGAWRTARRGAARPARAQHGSAVPRWRSPSILLSDAVGVAAERGDGGLWLLTATALLVVWYQVPIHDFQRAIMLGLAPYLLVFVTLLDLLRRHGWKVRAEVGLADSLAYMGVVFWVWAAWRRDRARRSPA